MGQPPSSRGPQYAIRALWREGGTWSHLSAQGTARVEKRHSFKERDDRAKKGNKIGDHTEKVEYRRYSCETRRMVTHCAWVTGLTLGDITLEAEKHLFRPSKLK